MEVYYDEAGRILDLFEQFCIKHSFPFKKDLSVRPYDSSTLFCIAGMQQYKQLFKDPTYINTLCNVQSCLRIKDLEEIEDGTHCLYFDMLGMFSFRQLTVKSTIQLWLEFLSMLGLSPDYVTIHPDKPDWKNLYPSDFDVRLDTGCTWSDGHLEGYCTEFYINGIEIGNIVNPLGTCIDVGFGLDRLEMVLNDIRLTPEETLRRTVQKVIESGYIPGNKHQDYVLRRLLRKMVKSGYVLDHPYWVAEKNRQERSWILYDRLKYKHQDKSSEWWWDTHGIDLKDMI